MKIYVKAIMDEDVFDELRSYPEKGLLLLKEVLWRQKL